MGCVLPGDINNCPRCHSEMETITYYEKNRLDLMKIFKRQRPLELTLDKCINCGGIWFDPEELNNYLKSQIILSEDQKMNKKDLDEYSDKNVKCPRCNVLLTVRPATGVVDMEIYKCRNCEGIWLDPDKLSEYEKTYRKATKNTN